MCSSEGFWVCSFSEDFPHLRTMCFLLPCRPRNEKNEFVEPKTFANFQLPLRPPYVWGTICSQYDWPDTVILYCNSLQHAAPHCTTLMLTLHHTDAEATICVESTIGSLYDWPDTVNFY